jgi:hypothetical protein
LGNEYGEIVGQAFTVTKAHSEIKETLKGFAEGRERLGHPAIQYVFTDDCCHDRGFLEQVLPSLLKNVQPLQDLRQRKYPVLSLPTDADINIVSDEMSAGLLLEQWQTESNLFAFDVEWEVNANGPRPVAIIQIGFQNKFAIFRMRMRNQSRSYPSLRKFLEDPKFKKFGVNIGGDIKKIFRDLGINVRSAVDIRQLAKCNGYIEYANGSLVDLVASCLQRHLVKNESARFSFWECDLSNDQIKYALLDVYACFKVL